MTAITNSKIDEQEEIQEDTDQSSDSGDWCVVLYNDEVHTFQEVIQWLIKYADQNKTKAENIAVVVDMRGEGICYTGAKGDCAEVKENLEAKGLDVEIQEQSTKKN